MLLRRRLLLLFVAIVAAVLALGGLMVLTLRERDEAQQRERRISVAVERVAQLSTAYADQETGERGYVIGNGKATFLQPYESGRAAARRLVPELQAALDTPRLRAQLQRVTAAMSTWREQAADTEIGLTRAGESARAEQLVAAGGGKALFDKVRSARATLARQVQDEQNRAQQHLDDIRSRLTRALRCDRGGRGGRRGAGRLAHPTLGDAADRPARRRGPTRARRRARLADPDSGSA